MKYLAAILLACTPTVTTAQLMPLSFQSQCSVTPEEIFVQTAQYNEKALFVGRAVDFPTGSETPVIGQMFFFVNQDTGTYSLVTIYDGGLTCLHRIGFDFEPYVD